MSHVQKYSSITLLDVMNFFQSSRDTYGKIVRLWIGNRAILVVYDPKVSESILTCTSTNLGKNDIYDLMVSWLGDGLLLSNGSKWHSRRKILTPAFHFNILEQFCEIFDKEASILVTKLKAYENEKSVKMDGLVSLMALDIVCQTAMGVEVHAQTDSHSTYVNAVHE